MNPGALAGRSAVRLHPPPPATCLLESAHRSKTPARVGSSSILSVVSGLFTSNGQAAPKEDVTAEEALPGGPAVPRKPPSGAGVGLKRSGTLNQQEVPVRLAAVFWGAREGFLAPARCSVSTAVGYCRPAIRRIPLRRGLAPGRTAYEAVRVSGTPTQWLSDLLSCSWNARPTSGMARHEPAAKPRDRDRNADQLNLRPSQRPPLQGQLTPQVLEKSPTEIVAGSPLFFAETHPQQYLAMACSAPIAFRPASGVRLHAFSQDQVPSCWRQRVGSSTMVGASNCGCAL